MLGVALELRKISKQFGQVLANHKVDLKVHVGSIHAIIGENGAGKSTAMKILCGFYHQDSGEIIVKEKKVRWPSPKEALASGIGMVYQHFMLAGTHTVFENIVLGTIDYPWSLIQKKEARLKIEKLSKYYGLALDLDVNVEKLSVGEQQRVEILKLLFRDTDILILDEPTAVLSPIEIESFFGQLRNLKNEGKTILLITHKLKEVKAIADKATIFRDGKTVAEITPADFSIEAMAELMVGRKLVGISDNRNNREEEKSSEVIISLPDFKVHAGEIVGIAGVEGNGQRTIIDQTLKLRTADSGMLPEKRLEEALMLGASLYENFLLTKWRQFSWWLSPKIIMPYVKEVLSRFDIRPLNANLIAKNFSGGNQQKFVVGRELWSLSRDLTKDNFKGPKFLLACQPTRGVDINAMEFIHQRILEQRDRGHGVLLVSSELDELLRLADRILVLYRGKIVKEFKRSEFNETKIGLAMAGGSSS